MLEFMSTYRYIIIPLTAMAAGQLLKLLTEKIFKRNEKRKTEGLIVAGGMPSSHAMFVFSSFWGFALYEGLTSPITAVSLVIALVVSYDSFNIRYHAGKQAKEINKLAKTHLEEHIGHTLIEVLVSIILSFIYTYIYFKIF